jgi:hypothetical protein
MLRSVLSRSLFVLGILVLGVCMLPRPAAGCPFCSMQGETLVNSVQQASLVLYGTFTNAKPSLGDDTNGGTTDLQIEAVIKKHEILGDAKVITLPRYIPSDKNSKQKFLVFCDVFKGKIDPYRGIPVQADCDMVKYLTESLEIQGKPIGQRLQHYFKYLDNKESEISVDAFREFALADYKDYREMAKSLPADKIAKWLEDPNTPQNHFGLYASMLGHCGKPEHAALLRRMLDDPQKRLSDGIDGMLAGYTMLKPHEGWAYVCDILKNPTKDFQIRYSALRAARFFWDSRPDLMDKKDLVEGVKFLLDQNDIADLAIEDLRRWKRWDLLDQILPLHSKKSHDAAIIRRSILKFALSCPDAKATEFVEQARKRDPEMVRDVEELLKLETPKG